MTMKKSDKSLVWTEKARCILRKRLLIIAAVCFFSCSEDKHIVADIYEIEEANDFKNPYECVGELHNEAMVAMKNQDIRIGEIGEFATVYIDNHKEKMFNVETSISDVEKEKLLSKAKK